MKVKKCIQFSGEKKDVEALPLVPSFKEDFFLPGY